jgi:hypothetical protein
MCFQHQLQQSPDASYISSHVMPGSESALMLSLAVKPSPGAAQCIASHAVIIIIKLPN